MKDERTFESLPHVLRNLGCGMAVFARLAEYAISIAVKKNITFLYDTQHTLSSTSLYPLPWPSYPELSPFAPILIEI